MSSETARAIDCLKQATKLNRDDPYLQGCVLMLPDYGQVVMTGDFHGHQRNFEKLQRFCRLDQTPIRHVMLHELIHAEPVNPQEPDMSHRLLLAAVEWKMQFPDQVHFLQSNHDLAQLNSNPITKGGRSALDQFCRGIAQTYADDAELVLRAIGEFITSLPLAGKTANRVFLSHAMPDVDQFDPSLLAQPVGQLDLSRSGPVHKFVWGRVRSAEQLERLAGLLDVNCFIVGHEPQEDGYALLHDRAIVLASDHNHGVFLPFDLKKPQSPAELARRIRKFVAVP